MANHPGTGKYEQLRGSGTYVGQRLSRDPDDFLSISYQTTWKGLADFDADPPAFTLSASVTKLKLPQRTYAMRVTLLVSNEEPGERVNYSLIVQSVGTFVPGGSRQGSTTSGRAAVTLRITPPRTARAVRLSVKASDPVGNENIITRSVKLP